MSQIPIQKTVLDRNKFNSLIDTSFSQLSITQLNPTLPVFTLDDFFQLYEQLFYTIPKEGDINSHTYILNKEAAYLGVQINSDNVQALLDEITSLRQEVTDAQETINTLLNK